MLKKNIFAITCSLCIVLADQVTKYMVKQNLTIGEPVSIVGHYFRFNYVTNPGMAFGIQVGSKLYFLLFSGIATVIILIFLFRLQDDSFWTRIALTAILGGAIGNFIDRITAGEVVDFIEIGPWPIFNIADIAVTFGMIALIIVIFREKNQNHTSQEEGFEIG